MTGLLLSPSQFPPTIAVQYDNCRFRLQIINTSVHAAIHNNLALWLCECQICHCCWDEWSDKWRAIVSKIKRQQHPFWDRRQFCIDRWPWPKEHRKSSSILSSALNINGVESWTACMQHNWDWCVYQHKICILAWRDRWLWDHRNLLKIGRVWRFHCMGVLCSLNSDEYFHPGFSIEIAVNLP